MRGGRGGGPLVAIRGGGRARPYGGVEGRLRNQLPVAADRLVVLRLPRQRQAALFDPADEDRLGVAIRLARREIAGRFADPDGLEGRQQGFARPHGHLVPLIRPPLYLKLAILSHDPQAQCDEDRAGHEHRGCEKNQLRTRA